ncbi:chitinase, partial [Kitasatospora sp. NPDC058965]
MERALPATEAPEPGRHRRKRSGLLAGVASLAMLAGAVAAAVTTGSAQASTAATTGALSPNWYASAPYLMPEDNNPPDAGAVMDATGQKAF